MVEGGGEGGLSVPKPMYEEYTNILKVFIVKMQINLNRKEKFLEKLKIRIKFFIIYLVKISLIFFIHIYETHKNTVKNS